MITNITDLLPKTKCTGCRACEQICPQKSIQMKLNIDGFLYPQVDPKRCSGCGLCQKICPSLCYQNQNFKKPKKIYAAIHKNSKVLSVSSSGGVFSALANSILRKGGIVYGCAWNPHMQAVHIRVTDEKDLLKLNGSKYVQDNTLGTFSSVKNDLQKGLAVLYTGTPCQIAGLKSYLQKDYSGLIAADIICHGVPSGTLFQDYLSWLEKNRRAQVVDYHFRDKKRGWGYQGEIVFMKQNQKIHIPVKPVSDPYYYFFLKGAINRECCYSCPYACSSRIGDFTIGDFWGIESIYPKINAEKGVSILLINSCRGQNLFPELSNELNLYNAPWESVVKWNLQLVQPSERPAIHDKLLQIEHERGFDGVAECFYKDFKMQRFRMMLKDIVPPLLRSRAKRILMR